MRIYTSDNDPLDFCIACSPSENEAMDKYGHLGDGPDGRGNCFAYDCEHPSYPENGYKCDGCGNDLCYND